MFRSDCRCCSDCHWYLDWFCECPDSPFAFVAPSLPAWSCRYFRQYVPAALIVKQTDGQPDLQNSVTSGI